MISERWLHIPYRHMGRTEDGCDCWGFVRLVLQEEKGKTLPAFDGMDEVEGMQQIRIFRQIPEAENWCIVRIEERKGHLHVGILIDGFVLHMTHQGVLMQRVRQLKSVIKGYYTCV